MKKLNQAGAIHFVILGLLLLGIAGGVFLITRGNPLKLFSKATQDLIVFTKLDGTALPKVDKLTVYSNLGVGVTVSTVGVELTSSLGPAGGNVSAPVSGPNVKRTISYKIAEDADGLKNASSRPYTSDPVITSFPYNINLPTCSSYENKFLWVEFEASDGTKDRRTAEIRFESNCLAGSADYKRVFVTSSAFDGNLGGLAGADAKCQESADSVKLGGTWKVWLSDSNTSASSRLVQHNTPYKLLDGKIVANNWADLTDGQIQNSISMTEFGKARVAVPNSGGTYAWTDTDKNGNKIVAAEDNPFSNCDNWTSLRYPRTGGDLIGYVGIYTDVSSRWTFYDGAVPRCSDKRPLYCFEQTFTPASTQAPVSGGGGGGGGGGGFNPIKSSSIPTPAKTAITDFAVSETRDFTGKFFQNYVPGVGVYHTFENSEPGQKVIFVQFRNSQGEIVKINGEDYISSSIELETQSAVEKPVEGGPGPSIRYTCTIGKICTCGDASKGDSRDPGKCSDCDGGWCNGGQCDSCGSDKPSSDVICASDVKTCPDGTYVLRDPNNSCQFQACGSGLQLLSCTAGQTECDCGNGNSKDPGKCDQCNGGWCKGDPNSSKGGICATCKQ